MLATHSLWQESAHVCFRRGMAGKARGGVSLTDSEVSGAPRTEQSSGRAGMWGSGRAASASPLAKVQDSRRKQGGQNQVGLGEQEGVWPGLGDRHLVPTAAQALPAFLAFNQHAHSRGEQQIKTCRVLAVQASGGWIIRAFRRRGREGKVGETGDHTGRHAQSRAAICRDFACRSGN